MARADPRLTASLRPQLGAGMLAACALVLAGCQTATVREDVAPSTMAIVAPGEIPEDELLDVGIQVLDVGALDPEALDEEGLSEEVRAAEARFVPVHLKHTMQRTGHWGAVRVLPAPSESVDVLVAGEILSSDGEVLELRVDVRDASGRRWYSRVYKVDVALSAYGDARRGQRDAFQSLYNTVANDLAIFRAQLGPGQRRAIRQIAELRFARDLAPDAFDGYLTDTDDGYQLIQRLPARDDPMLARVRTIRERDYMLVDTVNGYYDAFYDDMWEPYGSWRQYRGEEAKALRDLERKARTRQFLGIAAFAGAIAMDVFVGGNASASVRNLGLLGGAALMKSGFELSSQTEIHAEAIQELGTSFQAEVEPLVLDVDGETIRLTGNAETQFAAWRNLLKDIYREETGLDDAQEYAVSDSAPATVRGL